MRIPHCSMNFSAGLRFVAPLLATAACLHSGVAAAACGAAFCTLTTTPEAAHERRGQVRVDLSYEYLDQDTPYAGGSHGDGVQQARLDNGDVETVHRELYTASHRVGVRASAGLAERVTLELYLPVIVRSHEHFAFEGPEPAFGKFAFSGVGDVVVSARYSVLAPQNPDRPTVVLGVGLKTPTGSTDETGRVLEDGVQVNERSERSIQPGSGSWDPILSAYYLQRFGQFSTFANGSVRLPSGDAGYEFGNELLLNVGVSHPVAAGVEAILQLNSRITGRDDSRDEPELFHQNTGGEYLFVSPGLRAQVSPRFSMYGFVQVPIHRHVNGDQLTADWSISAGINYVFQGLR